VEADPMPGRTGPAELAAVPPQTAEQWRRDESRLYQSAVGSAEVYRRTPELVRRTLDLLRSLGPSHEPLLAAAAKHDDLVTVIAGNDGGVTAGLDMSLVANPALALRHREVAAEQAAGRRVTAMQAAAGRSQAWLFLDESGDAGGSPFQPYRRLEATTSGNPALLVTATLDAEFVHNVHEVQVLRINPETRVVSESGTGSRSLTSHLNCAREAHVALLRVAYAVLRAALRTLVYSL